MNTNTSFAMKSPNVHSESRLLTVNDNNKRSHRHIKSRHTEKDESFQKSMNMDLQPYIDDTTDNPNPVMEPVFEKKRKRI